MRVVQMRRHPVWLLHSGTYAEPSVLMCLHGVQSRCESCLTDTRCSEIQAQAAKLPKGVFECGSSALVATPDVSIQSCATSSALLSGTAVSFSPTTPKAGSPLVVSVTGTLCTSSP